MSNTQITVFYKWIAKPGMLDELKTLYHNVYKAMEENEPDSLMMECYISETENALVVHDLFKNAKALSFHLTGTAAKHFPQLVKVSNPGAFIFCGDVPEELQKVASDMGLQAEFHTYAFGFDRSW